MSEGDRSLTIQEALDLAIQHQNGGLLREAENIYQRILQTDPYQPQAIHLLGVIAYQTGRNELAVNLITKALTIQPNIAEAHSNLGLALQTLGKLDDAIASFRKALALQPNYAAPNYNLGVTFETLGKLDDALASYQKALDIRPDYTEAHFNIGNIFQGLGKLDNAAISYRQAVAIKPDYAEAHNNLGATLQKMGKLEKAALSFREALAIQPSYAEAHTNLGVTLQALGKLEEAVASHQRALGIRHDYADAHYNLGVTLQEIGKIGDAVVSYRKALELKPSFFKAHYNLGVTLQELGKLDDALASYHKALAINPDMPEVHNNLGLVLQRLGKLEDAESSYQKVFTINPDFHEALQNYGILLIILGRWEEALVCLDRKLELVRGESPVDPELSSFRLITKAKIQHDIEQFRYLENVGSGTNRMGQLAQTYESLKQEIEWPEGDNTTVPLTDKQFDVMRSSYNRPLHLNTAPEVMGRALNANLDPQFITQDYARNAPGMTYFDNFLNPEALHSLRRFLLESTIWYDFTIPGGVLGAMLGDGMACPLLFQIAEEFRRTFPGILKNHRLNQIWAYKYDSRPTGITVHADAAAINVNFWITRDSANLNPHNGGLVVYKEEAPLDWGYRSYNSDTFTRDGNRRIRKFLSEHDSGKMVVPYAENRVVVFNSDLFHETDSLEFKPGYENRRINVTMLFGNRWD